MTSKLHATFSADSEREAFEAFLAACAPFNTESAPCWVELARTLARMLEPDGDGFWPSLFDSIKSAVRVIETYGDSFARKPVNDEGGWVYTSVTGTEVSIAQAASGAGWDLFVKGEPRAVHARAVAIRSVMGRNFARTTDRVDVVHV